MQFTSINTFEGGLNQDTALVSLPSNQYDEANDCEFISDDKGQMTTIEPKRGTGLAKFQAPNAAVQTKLFRIKTYADTTRIGGTDYYTAQNIFFKDKDGNTLLNASLSNANPFINNFVFAGDLQTALGGSSIAIVDGSVSNDAFYTTIELISDTLDNVVSVTQEVFINGGAYYVNNLLLLRDLIKTETQLEVLSYVNTQNYGFILSVSEDNTITELGVVDEDNNWAYTRLLRTKDFVLSKTHPIKLLAEQQNDGVYCLYFTDNTIKDKCIIVPQSLTEDCCLTYTPSSYSIPSKGVYNLQQTDAQTNSQLVNNIIYITYKETLQSGGALTTGGKRYAVRSGINGSNITTEWSILSNIVPVILDSADSPLSWVNTQGTPNGQPTSKRNVLTINNAQADIFNFIEVAVVNYTGLDATSAEIIGRYDVTAESFDIIHSGLEQTALLDVNLLIPSEPIITKVKDIEIKKNRLNRANTVTANEDAKWLAIAESASLSTERFEVTSTGKLPNNLGNLRFYGSGNNQTYDVTEDNETNLITFTTPTPPSPIPSPSPYVGGVYTATASDTPTLQVNLTETIRVNAYSLSGTTIFYETFAGVYFLIKRNGQTVVEDAVFEQSLNDVISISSDPLYSFSIPLKKTYSITANAGDTITFSWRLYIGSNKLEIIDSSTVTLLQGSVQSALQFTGTQIGEYQIPFNVANRSGYMLYEYYLGYVRFHLKNGYTTAPYPIGKYTLADLTEVRGLVQILPSNPNTPFSDTNTLNDRVVYNYAIKVNNLDISSVQDELLGVSFERSEPLNTVIGSGIYHNARKFEGDIYTSGLYNLSGSPLSATNDLRKFGIFISNDLSNESIKFSNGDYLKILGIPLTLSYNDNFKSGTNKKGVTNEFLGSVSTNAADVMTSNEYTIVDSTSIGFNEIGNILSNTSGNLYYKPSTSQTNNAYYNGLGVAISTLAYVRTQSPTDPSCTEKNTYVAFYIRTIDLSTVDYKNYKPIPTGEIFKIESGTNPLINQAVYGGDTYTQKVIRKSAFWYQENNIDDTIVSSILVGFYAQNRLNSQLFYNDNTAPIETWNLQGSKSLYQYLFPFSDSSQLVDEQHNFDRSYIGSNSVNRISPFNPRLPYPTSNPTRIYYSDLKAVGSLYDAYRKVRPLNYVDLELQNGAITAIFDIRDVMVVIQPNFVGAIPYAADTMIQSDNTARILVGSGDVYSNRVYPLSSYGTSIKTLTCKGYNANGNPQVYWLSDDFTNFNRYDYSGVKILSNENNMRTFFLNNVAHIKNEFDANIYYNTKKEDIVITVRATKILPEWNAATTYSPLTYVVFGADGMWKNFEQTKAVYVSNTTNTNSNPYNNPTDWTFVPFTETSFYNMWSLIFNEKFNNFRTFFSPLQKRYFRHNNYTLSPRGITALGKVYLMDNVQGDYMQWFPLSQGSTNYKQGEFRLSTIFNKYGTDKKMVNVSFERGDDVAVEPTTVTAITPTQSIDFPIKETRREATYYPSYYDENGDNPYGQYIKILIKKASFIKIRTIAALFKNKFPIRAK